MIDKTTVGVTAEPEEVEAVLHNLCGYHLSEPDPVFRYTVLTREQVLYDALVTAIKRERGRALAELARSGRTLTQVAEMTNLGSRQRVQRLIAMAKAAETAAAEVQAASREFEDRLAAVEATLDEVVSGLPAGSIPAARAPIDDLAPDSPASDGVAPDGVAPHGENRGPVAGVDQPAPADPDREPDPTAVLEPTQMMPALAASLTPTKEMPSADDAPWWRRSRDTRDTGAA